MSKEIIRKFVWGNNHIPKRVRSLNFEAYQNFQEIKSLETLDLERKFDLVICRKADINSQSSELRISFENQKMKGARFIITSKWHDNLLRIDTSTADSVEREAAFWEMFYASQTFLTAVEAYNLSKVKKESDE